MKINLGSYTELVIQQASTYLIGQGITEPSDSQLVFAITHTLEQNDLRIRQAMQAKDFQALMCEDVYNTLRART